MTPTPPRLATAASSNTTSATAREASSRTASAAVRPESAGPICTQIHTRYSTAATSQPP